MRSPDRRGRQRAAAVGCWAGAFAAAGALASLSGAPLGDPHIPGFRFPESAATLVGWVHDLGNDPSAAAASAAFERLHQHGWGLWTALTAETAQRRDGRALRVFETWTGPEEIADPAEPPGRLRPFPPFQPGRLGAGPRLTVTDGPGGGMAGAVIGFVAYDPSAAEHIRRQHLLSAAALNRLLEAGEAQVPPFPSTALATKAAYQVLSASQLVAGRYYALKVWSGPPAAPQAWDPAKWSGCVWIDLQDGGLGRGGIDGVGAPDGSSRTAATTYPLSRLIHHPLSVDEASALNRALPAASASPGDPAVLVALHVAGREMTRWTWQTFWWTPRPEDPSPPSSPDIAALRPDQLQGPARNYAMALGYDMSSPGQPVTGGRNTGLSSYVYNPWLEARFGPADLPDSQPGRDPAGQVAPNDCGVESNCMSCHSRANYNPRRLATAPRYAGARYVDLADPQFAGTLQLDFLWTLAEDAR
jgi:hypothetical protein